MALIDCRDLSLGYEGRVVSEKLNFQVNGGDYLYIIGENGSGKSTLMKTLLGLQSPLKGTITFGDGLKKNEIGYLPQQTEVQKDFPATVGEVVISGCLNTQGLRPFYSKSEKAKANLWMEKLDITKLKKRCYRELSGGQQQRVLLARALCATKKLIILDEPVTGLDPKVTSDMYELIKAVNEKEKITVVMVSHDVSAAVKYATKILHVSHEPLFFGDTSDYIESDAGKDFLKKAGEDNA